MPPKPGPNSPVEREGDFPSDVGSEEGVADSEEYDKLLEEVAKIEVDPIATPTQQPTDLPEID